MHTFLLRTGRRRGDNSSVSTVAFLDFPEKNFFSEETLVLKMILTANVFN